MTFDAALKQVSIDQDRLCDLQRTRAFIPEFDGDNYRDMLHIFHPLHRLLYQDIYNLTITSL